MREMESSKVGHMLFRRRWEFFGVAQLVAAKKKKDWPPAVSIKK